MAAESQDAPPVTSDDVSGDETDLREAEQIFYHDDEDDEPPTTPLPSSPPARGGHSGRGRGGHRGRARANLADWRHSIVDVDPHPFEAPKTGPLIPEDVLIERPEHAAKLFVDNESEGDSFVKLIQHETNLYLFTEKAKPGCPRSLKDIMPFSIKEVYSFLAIIMSMGLVKCPSDRDYWSTDPLLSQPFIRSIMPRDRFLAFKRCLSVGRATAAERADDKLAMIRPLINLFHRVSHRYYCPKCDMGLDETQCQCGHRFAPISHRGDNKATKPLHEYIKTFGIHESGTGYCWAFEVDLRDATTVRDTVYKLVDTLPHKGYRIATDRYYTSVDTAVGVRRRGHHMYGTLRKDRGFPSELKATVEGPNAVELEDGEVRWMMAPIYDAPPEAPAAASGHNPGDPLQLGGMIAGIWRDTSASGVPFLSTCHGPEMSSVMRRKKRSSGARGRGREPKPAPMVMVHYNQNMGAVDQSNALKAVYSSELKHQRRWYLTLFYYVFELLLLNSRVVYETKVAPISHKGYRLAIIQWLKVMAERGDNATPPATKRRRLAGMSDLPACRLLGTACDHKIIKASEARERRGCKWCYVVLKKQKNSSYKCDQCDSFLHVPDCWNMWHEQ